MKTIFSNLTLSILFFVGTFSLRAQPTVYSPETVSDSTKLQLKLGMLSTLSAQNEQTFWLTRNDLGLLNDQNANALLMLDGAYRFQSFTFLRRKAELNAGWKLAYNPSQLSRQVFFPILFGQLKWHKFQLDAGRFTMNWDRTVDQRINSGDILYGTNSVPIPMIRLSTSEAVKPFKKLFPEFGVSGYFIHGWFENDRFVRAAYLHAKNLTLELDLDGFKPVFGLSHNVQWAGTSAEYGNLPDNFSDFLDVFSGQSSSNENAPEGEIINVVGNHIGSWNMGFDMESPTMKSSLRFHHIFEDGSGKRMRNGSDGMIRMELIRKESKSGNQHPLISAFIYEYYNTTNASGWGTTDAPNPGQAFDEFGFRYGGRDSYFTNFIYRSGWTYRDQAINSPFFMTDSEAERWAPEGQEIQGRGIASGSILAHHIGFSGDLLLFGSKWKYRQKASVVRYYGNSYALPTYFAPYRPDDDKISTDYAFYPDVTQYYVRLDFEKTFKLLSNNVLTTFSFAVDRGEWQRNFGLGIQLEWEI